MKAWKMSAISALAVSMFNFSTALSAHAAEGEQTLCATIEKLHAQPAPNKQQIVSAYAEMAALLQLRKRSEEAAGFALWADAMEKHITNPNDRTLSEYYDTEATALIKIGQIKKAVRFAEHSLNFARCAFPKDAMREASAHELLASSMIADKREYDALRHLEKARDLLVKAGLDSRRLFQTIALSAGMLHQRIGSLDDAEENFRLALRGMSLDPARAPVFEAQARSMYSQLLIDMGKYPAAETEARLALKLLEASQAPGSPAIINALASLAVIFIYRGKSAEAESILAGIPRAASRQTRISTARTYINLGAAAASTSQWDFAAKYFQMAIASFDPEIDDQSVIEAGHVNLGRALQEKGNHRAALASFEQATAIEQYRSPLRLSGIMLSKGISQAALGDRTTARTNLLAAIVARRSLLGESNPATIEAEWKAAKAIVVMGGEPAEARTLYLAAQNGMVLRLNQFLTYDREAAKEVAYHRPLLAGLIKISWQLTTEAQGSR